MLAVPTPFHLLTSDLVEEKVDAVLSFGASAHPDVTSTRLSPIRRIGLVGSRHRFARRHSVPAAEFAAEPMVWSPELPASYMHPFVLADVRPLSEATLVAVDATNTAHVAQRVMAGREVTVVPLALTANLPPELVRVVLRDLPETWYHAHRRAGDDRPELCTAIELMSDFTESITRAAQG